VRGERYEAGESTQEAKRVSERRHGENERTAESKLRPVGPGVRDAMVQRVLSISPPFVSALRERLYTRNLQ
jgi:hypothetical protein